MRDGKFVPEQGETTFAAGRGEPLIDKTAPLDGDDSDKEPNERGATSLPMTRKFSRMGDLL